MRQRDSEYALRQFIDEVSFAIDEIVLYLDTHPCDEEALSCYKEYKKMRKDAMDEYARSYGPLCKDNVYTESEWSWALQPWPWKGEC